MKEVWSVGKEAGGVKKKVKLCPWLDENADEITDFQDQLRDLTEEIRTSNHPEQLRAVRRRVRKQYRKAKTTWEEEQQRDTKNLYRALRELGNKNLGMIETKFFLLSSSKNTSAESNVN